MNGLLERLRIMHVMVSDAFAGVERYVSRLAGAQAELGHHVVVIGGDVAAMRGSIGPDAAVAVAESGGLLEATQRIRTVGRRADIIHLHMTGAEVAASLAAVTALPRRAAVVSTRHFGRPRGHGPQAKFVSAIARWTLDAEIAISEYVAHQIDGEATVVYSGVDNRSDARPAADREPVVLMVQRLELEKGTEFGLRTFAESGLSDRGWRLRIAGDGSQRRSLERLTKELGLADSIEFLGTRSDVAELMADAAVLFAPCSVEALGLSVLEAMASGLPVIGAAAGGHLELLSGLDPRALYPVDEHHTAAHLLADLANDRGGRDRYAAAAQTRQRTHFTLAAQVAGTDRVYRSVL